MNLVWPSRHGVSVDPGSMKSDRYSECEMTQWVVLSLAYDGRGNMEWQLSWKRLFYVKLLSVVPSHPVQCRGIDESRSTGIEDVEAYEMYAAGRCCRTTAMHWRSD
jgi:hypothetical protein